VSYEDYGGETIKKKSNVFGQHKWFKEGCEYMEDEYSSSFSSISRVQLNFNSFHTAKQSTKLMWKY
jgi:hypothetical protein